jgi:hypothetical protein
MDPQFTTPALTDQFLEVHAADIAQHGWTGLEIERLMLDFLARVAAPLHGPHATPAERRTALRLCNYPAFASLMSEVRRRGRLRTAKEVLNRAH